MAREEAKIESAGCVAVEAARRGRRTPTAAVAWRIRSSPSSIAAMQPAYTYSAGDGGEKKGRTSTLSRAEALPSTQVSKLRSEKGELRADANCTGSALPWILALSSMSA